MTNLAPHLVIFDLDGTLVDSIGDLHHALAAMLERLGRAPVTREETRFMVGEGARRLVEQALDARPGASVTLDEATALFVDLYESHPPTHSLLYPGVRTTLDGLAASGILCAVSTNKPARPARLLLDALGIGHSFKAVTGGDTHPFRKPDPRMLTRLMEQFGAPPAATLLVGDSEIDAATAAAATVPFVLVTEGYRRGPAQAIPATARIPRMDDLLSLIARPGLTGWDGDD